jgi:hypothetical protein
MEGKLQTGIISLYPQPKKRKGSYRIPLGAMSSTLMLTTSQPRSLRFHVRLQREPVVGTVQSNTQNDANDPQPPSVTCADCDAAIPTLLHAMSHDT